jgi:hypothetical protein
MKNILHNEYWVIQKNKLGYIISTINEQDSYIMT